MTYFPLGQLQVLPVSQVSGPALFWNQRPDRPPMIVTAETDRMFVILDGEDVGRSGRVHDIRMNGYALAGLSFEVDHSSQFRSSHIDEPIGALILGPSGVRITTLFRNSRGFDEVRDFPLLDEMQPESESQDIGFSRWRAVVGEGHSRIVALEFESTRKGNR